MTDRFVNPIIKYTTSTLKTMPGAELYFYITGTTTPKVTYQDFNGTIEHAQPVTALSDGHFPPIFLDGTYRAELKYLGITQPGWPVDNIGATNDPAPLADWNPAFSYSIPDLVTGPDGNRYESQQDNNLNNDPTAPGSLYWSRVFLAGNVDTWEQLDIAARSGSGPKADAKSAITYSLDMTDSGQNLIKIPNQTVITYPQINADETVTALTAIQLFDNIKQDASTSNKGVLVLATSAEVIAGAVTNKAVAPSTLVTLTATETRAGLTEYATPAETVTGTDNTRSVTPLGLSGVLGRQVVPNAAAFASTSAFDGQLVYLIEHTSGKKGGGNFIGRAGSPTPNNVNIFASATVGFYYQRQNPSYYIYEGGFVDGGTDASVAINACMSAYNVCYLDGGKTYNLQYQINAIVLKAAGGVATLNLTSPTGNTRWGGPSSSYGNTAAILALGGAGSPLKGVEIENIIVECNKLIGATGSVGIKGIMNSRNQSFKVKGCTVNNCASYAFWAMDDATTGTTYCSGTYDDCYANNSAVSFEQVNVRGVTLNNCRAYIGAAALGYTPEFMFHPYGGSDMQVVYNNCIGISDGVCPSIFGALLECKNVTANDCQFINRYNGGASIQAAVYFENSGGNFGGIAFNNCILRSDFFASVILLPGAAGSSTAEFSFTDCTIDGKSIGVQFNGTGGYYSFVNCITTGTSISGGTAFGYNNNGTGPVVQVTGGRATGTGGVSPQASNLSASSFNKTILTPASSGTLNIRQTKMGTAALTSSGTYSSVLVSFPAATVDATKVTITYMIDATGAATGAAAAALAVPLSFIRIDATNYRIYAVTGAAGSNVNYTITEYE